LVSVRDNLRQKGFSETATKHISRSVRESTSIVYDAKWTIFSDWCVGREIDEISIVREIADLYPFTVERARPFTSNRKTRKSANCWTEILNGSISLPTHQSEKIVHFAS
jgi:hypothetical protein